MAKIRKPSRKAERRRINGDVPIPSNPAHRSLFKRERSVERHRHTAYVKGNVPCLVRPCPSDSVVPTLGGDGWATQAPPRQWLCYRVHHRGEPCARASIRSPAATFTATPCTDCSPTSDCPRPAAAARPPPCSTWSSGPPPASPPCSPPPSAWPRRPAPRPSARPCSAPCPTRTSWSGGSTTPWPP